jgi:hypothetical protein
VFITAGPITKLFAWGEGDSGGHVLRGTTSRGLCGQKILFSNGELNLLWPDGGCPLQTGTGHGWPGQAPGRC